MLHHTAQFHGLGVIHEESVDVSSLFLPHQQHRHPIQAVVLGPYRIGMKSIGVGAKRLGGHIFMEMLLIALGLTGFFIHDNTVIKPFLSLQGNLPSMPAAAASPLNPGEESVCKADWTQK